MTVVPNLHITEAALARRESGVAGGCRRRPEVSLVSVGSGAGAVGARGCGLDRVAVAEQRLRRGRLLQHQQSRASSSAVCSLFLSLSAAGIG